MFYPTQKLYRRLLYLSDSQSTARIDYSSVLDILLLYLGPTLSRASLHMVGSIIIKSQKVIESFFSTLSQTCHSSHSQESRS